MATPSFTPQLRARQRERLSLLIVQIVITIGVVIFLLPTAWMVASSLKGSTEIFSPNAPFFPANPQWSNYEKAMNSPGLPMPRFFFNSFVVTSLAVLGTVVSSAMVAYAFARIRWPGRDLAFALLIATTLLPEIVMLIPRFIIFRNAPWLGSLGVQPPPELLNVFAWLGNPKWIDTPLPLVVPYALAGTGLYVFLIRQFFKGIPMELEEAAVVDGANRWQIFWRVILPLAKPALVSVAVFALIQHYNSFLEPLIFLNSKENWTLPIALRALNVDQAVPWELIFAAATIIATPMVVLFMAAQRYFVEGIATTGFGGR